MNRIIGTVLMVLGLVVPDQAAYAQSNDQTALVDSDESASARSNCKEETGNLVEFWDGGGEARGKLTNGGWLNGATVAVFNSTGYSTPVPTAFSFTTAFTVTTHHGELKGTAVYLYDNGTGWGAAMVNIDPNAGTGLFAGATGVLYLDQVKSNTSPAPTTYVSKIRALICFARGLEPRDR